jgi:NADH-quinone oxidoreductase subunit A
MTAVGCGSSSNVGILFSSPCFYPVCGCFWLYSHCGGLVLGPSKPDAEKLSPFECGFEPFEDARIKFDVRYYLLAILFILFDLEIAFLFPWATILKEIAANESIRLFGSSR